MLALPPDETDPETDYLWRVAAPEHPEWPTGTGFTSHQAVHDLLEQLEGMGVVIDKVNQIHDAA